MSLLLGFAAHKLHSYGLAFAVTHLDVDRAVHVLIGLMHGDSESLAGSEHARGFRRCGIDKEGAAPGGRYFPKLQPRIGEGDSIFRKREAWELAAIDAHCVKYDRVIV